MLPAGANATPAFDERFTGYGKNKIQHVTHLRWAGWRFAVLPRECFLTHFPHPISDAKRAWLTNRALHSSVDALYSQFTQELMDRYSPQGGPMTKLCGYRSGKRPKGAAGG